MRKPFGIQYRSIVYTVVSSVKIESQITKDWIVKAKKWTFLMMNKLGFGWPWTALNEINMESY